MLTLYGIKNCDSVAKARKWLSDNHIDYTFHDFRVDGLSESTLKEWFSRADWQLILNKRSRSWKEIDESIRSNIDEASTIQLMLDTPTLIKRPVLTGEKLFLIGFRADDYQQLLET